jgi:hypothetical protein
MSTHLGIRSRPGESYGTVQSMRKAVKFRMYGRERNFLALRGEYNMLDCV